MKPNIILILTDHFRRDAVGPSTPNLQALAAEGTLFENAYCAAPLCQPARCSLITGMFPSQHGVCGNQSPPIPDALRDNTFMHRLRDAGYFTAMIGKHHYIDRYGLGVDLRDDNDEIGRYGFDHVFQVADERPFYLNLSFIGPHPPFWHPGELRHDPDGMPPPLGVPDNAADRRRRAHYMEKCSLIDRYIGRLVEALKKKGIYENTVIVFTSDHGENAGDFGIWDKRFFYEHIALDLIQRILAHPVAITQFTHAKEEQRVQRVRIV